MAHILLDLDRRLDPRDALDGGEPTGHPPARALAGTPASPTEGCVMPPDDGPWLLDQMDTPPLVAELLRRLPADVPAELRPEFERQFKMSYYFEGLTVAFRRTPAGPEIVASGPDAEVYEVLDRLTPADRRRVTLDEPPPLARLAAPLVRRSEAIGGRGTPVPAP